MKNLIYVTLSILIVSDFYTAFAQDNVIEFKIDLVKKGVENVNQSLLFPLLENTVNQAKAAAILKILSNNRSARLDMEIFEIAFADNMSVIIDLGGHVSVFENNELIKRTAYVSDMLSFYRSSGIEYEIGENSITFKDDAQIAKTLEVLWNSFTQKNLILNYRYTDGVKKPRQFKLAMFRDETPAVTAFFTVCMAPGTDKRTEWKFEYKDIELKETNLTVAPEEWKLALSVWHENYTLDNTPYSDVIIAVTDQQLAGGIMQVFRYLQSDFIGSGSFVYLIKDN